MIKKILILLSLFPLCLFAQINTERVMMIARNALYFEDYVLSIQYFNQVISAKPYLFEPYFYRGLAKINLDDYQGAEADCDEAIRRNPFVVGAYQIRGLARIKQNNFEGAIEDYRTALKYDPENLVLWHNLTLCHMQEEDYADAQDDLAQLLKIAPRYTRAYLMRGEVYMKQNDTISALKDFDKAIELDKYDADGWSARAMVYLQQAKYKEAESDLTQAIRLSVKNTGNYINRALARFHQNNLRGAMRDYDLALDIDPNNFIGHYNRGLLRAQTGDYQGAISDYSRVIEEYPNFLTGYYYRAEARRKMGDRKGAEQDEFKVMQAQLDRLNNRSSSGNDEDVADNQEAKEDGDEGKTRKQSDKNIRNYRKIVIADDDEASQRYTSDYRGRVQNRNVVIKLEPMYALSYYERISEVKKAVHYYAGIDSLNLSKQLPKPLKITNMESPLTEEQVRYHFALIDSHTSDIVADPNNALKRFMRGMDFYLVQDFDSSIDDFTQSILLDGDFFPAYFMRALVRYKQLDYKKAEAASENNRSGASVSDKQEQNITAVDYEVVKKDLDKVIELAPDFVYGYYNRGNVSSALKDYRAALEDYDKALELDPEFAEAYFNRGLTHIFLGNNKQGIMDLSKAGELGIVSAYNIIKRFTDVQE